MSIGSNAPPDPKPGCLEGRRSALLLVLVTGLIGFARLPVPGLRTFASASGKLTATPGEGAVVLEGARLIDGTGRAPLENATLVVERGAILAVGPNGSLPYPKEAKLVSLSGKTVMPALICIHGHLGQTADGMHPAAYTAELVRSQLEKYLNYGVGTMLSLGGDQDLVYVLRAQQRSGGLPGARLYTAGRGFGVKGGYPPGSPPFESGMADRYRPETPEEARADVRELALNHPDLVKIWCDDDFGRMPKIKPEIYRAIIDEAHRHHLRVMAHVFYLADAQSLVDAGVDGLAHSVRDQAVDTKLIESMKARGVFLVPTLVRDESTFAYANGPVWLHDPFFDARLAPGILDALGGAAFVAQQRANPDLPRLRAAFEMGKRNLKTLFDAGVRIGFGTDSGPPLRFQGYFEHRELQLMVESGLTPMQAIVCATRNAAQDLGAGGRLGTLEPGKAADFLVLDANPLDDIHNTEKLSAVWQSGKPVER
ncbi:MAG TPA: amidohydrolase family protein [Terriglobia bacterium]|nr:amidohydrolase family protein [Terriglobia bacterium]